MAWRQNWSDDDNQGGTGGGRYRHVRFTGRGSTEGTRTILMITIGVFVLQQIMGTPRHDPLVDLFGLSVQTGIRQLQLWRFITFQFLHAGLSHIFWNLFIFYMFGRIVELQLGTRKFVSLYLLSGVAGGLAQVAITYIMAQRPEFAGAYANYLLMIPTVGASAGVAGITIAFAFRNPESPIYLFFVLPVKAKWAAIGYVAITTWLMIQAFRGQQADNIAHAAHLGGMVYAFLWMLADRNPSHHQRRNNGGGIWHSISSKFRGLFSSRSEGQHWSPPRAGGPGSGPFNHPVTGRSEGGPGISSQEEQRLDEILRKVHMRGLGSLTEEEREFLHRVSAKKRDTTSP